MTTPAEAYQSYYGPAIFEPLSRHVLATASPRPGDRVLDVACGSGILTRHLATAVGPTGHVVGLDLNPQMLDVARRLGGAVDYRQGDATATDLPDASFDAAYCQQGLQFFPDRSAGTKELRRVVTDGGLVVIAAWRDLAHHPLFAALADAEEPHLAALGVEVTRADLEAPFSLGDTDELADLLGGAGFESVELQPVSIDARFADADHFVERMEFAYAAVVPRFVEDPPAFAHYLDAIRGATTDIVEQHRQGDEVVVPMHATVAVAR